VLRPHCKHLVQPHGVGPKRECKNRAQPNSEYCTRHKDHPDRRIEAATASLHDYVDTAIRSLGQVVGDHVKHRGAVRDSDAIKAAVAILNRTGHGPTSTVTVQDADERLNEILRARRSADDGT